MPSQPNLKTKLFFGSIGLAAVIVPVILISTNFQPWWFIFPNQSTTTNLNPTTIPLNSQNNAAGQVSSSPTPGVSILSTTEFEQQKIKPGVILVDLRPDPKALVNGSAKLTPLALENRLKEYPKGSTILLISDDLISSQALAGKIIQSGLQTGIYLPKQ